MKEGKAYRYAQWCVEEDGGKVPQYVKKQAESWLHIADGDNPDAYVDEQEYEKICKDSVHSAETQNGKAGSM